MITESRVPAWVRSTLPAALLLLALLATWQIYVVVFNVKRFILPPPTEVFASLFTKWAIYQPHAIVTFREAAIGLLLATVVGLILAMLITASSALRMAIYPLVVATQAMPVIAIAPLLIIWFGYGPTSKILVAALVAFFPIVVSAAAGLASLDDGAVRLMRSFPCSQWHIFSKARLPHALPQIFSGLKVAAVLSVVGAVVGEWVGSNEGLGYLIIQSNAKLAIVTVFGSVVVLTLMGIALFLIVTLIEWLSLPWNRRPQH
jgi:ABC-type nitrate/sulfonate/bicarbonate transport system permease component